MTDQNNPDTSDSANGSALQTQPEPDVKTFTQADVNRIAGQTRQEALAKFAKGLGLDSPDELEKVVKAQREAQDAAKSELQKALDAKQAAEQQAQQALNSANDKLIRAAFMAEAGRLQAQHPQDAYLLSDLSAVTIDDSGNVTGVEDAVNKLVESGRLPTAGKPKPPNLDSGAGSGERSTDKATQLSQEEITMAQNMGLSLEDYAKNKK